MSCWTVEFVFADCMNVFADGKNVFADGKNWMKFQRLSSLAVRVRWLDS